MIVRLSSIYHFQNRKPNPKPIAEPGLFDRIRTMSSPWMAAENPPESQDTAPQKTPGPKSLNGVLGTGREKPTTRWEKGREQRAVNLDHQYGDMRHQPSPSLRRERRISNSSLRHRYLRLTDEGRGRTTTRGEPGLISRRIARNLRFSRFRTTAVPRVRLTTTMVPESSGRPSRTQRFWPFNQPEATRYSNRKTFPPPAAAARQNRPPPRCAHTLTEPMGIATLTIARLIGPFHRNTPIQRPRLHRGN